MRFWRVEIDAARLDWSQDTMVEVLQASWPNAFRMTNRSGWRTKMKQRWQDELAATKTRKRLLPRGVQFERQDSGVRLEIGVGGKIESLPHWENSLGDDAVGPLD